MSQISIIKILLYGFDKLWQTWIIVNARIGFGKNHAHRIESHFIFPTKISNTFDFWSKEMSCLFLFLVTILTCSSHCTISLLAFCKGHKWCAKKFMTVTFSCFSFWPNFMGKASTAAKVFHIEIALTMKYLQYFFLNWTLMFLAK